MGRRIRARSTKKNAAATKEGRRGNVDELSAVIRLKTLDRQLELGMSIVSKIDNMCMNLRFLPKRKHPAIMAIIIDNHKIIFKAKHTKDWRCPDITYGMSLRCRGPRGSHLPATPSDLGRR